jgi:thiol-disulfide isomerase/thioredoxin
MRFTPDALALGPFVLEWGRLSLVLGLMAFMTLASRTKNPRLERAAWVAVLAGIIAGRVGYALESGAFELSLVDPRVGGLSWVWATIAGVVSGLLVLRQDIIKLVPHGLFALVIAFVPQLLRPAVNATPVLPATAKLERVRSSSNNVTSSEITTWGNQPKPVLVNVWATWCGPCRAEMPLLARYATNGAGVLFLNAGEDASTIRQYLAAEKLSITVHRDLENLRSTLQVSGLPTSFVIGTDGRVIRRHMGPLDRAQLEALLGLLK